MISIAGPLNIDGDQCAHAGQARAPSTIFDDRNVLIAGGVGPRGVSRVDLKSEERTRRILDACRRVQLEVLPGTDHFLDHIQETLQRVDGVTVAEKAVRFFFAR